MAGRNNLTKSVILYNDEGKLHTGIGVVMRFYSPPCFRIPVSPICNDFSKAKGFEVVIFSIQPDNPICSPEMTSVNDENGLIVVRTSVLHCRRTTGRAKGTKARTLAES